MSIYMHTLTSMSGVQPPGPARLMSLPGASLIITRAPRIAAGVASSKACMSGVHPSSVDVYGEESGLGAPSHHSVDHYARTVLKIRVYAPPKEALHHVRGSTSGGHVDEPAPPSGLSARVQRAVLDGPLYQVMN